MPDFWMDVDTALAEVPVNLMPLVDDTDFKAIEDAVAYNAAGLTLFWHFVTTAGAYTVTAVTPTTGGDYDWTDQGTAGVYTIEIPASGGASINNDTEGFGWFTGKATGVLPWRGPTIGFRAAGLNNLLIDDAYSATRGLTGTALPNAAADAAGGLPISDAGGLDLDAKLANTNEVTAARMGALTDWINGGRLDLLLDAVKAKTDNLPTDPADESLLIAATDAIMSRLGVPAGASVSADVAALKVDTAAILTDTGTTLEGHLTDIKGATFNGATDSLEAIRDYTSPAATALSTVQWTNARAGYMDKLNVSGTLLHDALTAWLRTAGFIHNRMTIDDATGAYTVRNAADSADLATGTITDDALTSVRSAPTWV